MSNPFIIVDEIEELLNDMNDDLTATINTVNNNVNTVINNTKINNTASGTGSLSQKLSWIGNTLIGATGQTGGSATAGTVMAKLNAAITNTAATTTENSSGTLSAKLSYLINRRNKTVTPSSTVIKTLNSSGNVTSPTADGKKEVTAWGTTYTCYVKYSGIYRAYFTCKLDPVSTSVTGDTGYAIGYVYIYQPGASSATAISATICSGTAAVAATTKSIDFPAYSGNRIQMRILCKVTTTSVAPCNNSFYILDQWKATWTDISLRGTVNEINGAVV